MPHYPLAAGRGDVPIYQSFVLGRALFVTDGRSERPPRRRPDAPEKTALGGAQKAWLRRTLLARRDRYAVIVWVNSFPWIGKASAGSDLWAGYDTERRELARFIEEQGISNLVMVSCDAHMLVIDDGSNNRYAPSGASGFPVLQAGALDRRGSLKGGPYSHGAFPGSGQFALMTIEDEGGPTVKIRWSGRNYKDEELVGLELELHGPLHWPSRKSAPPSARQTGSASRKSTMR